MAIATLIDLFVIPHKFSNEQKNYEKPDQIFIFSFVGVPLTLSWTLGRFFPTQGLIIFPIFTNMKKIIYTRKKFQLYIAEL